MNTKTARDLRFNLFLTSWQTRWASPSHAQKCLGSWGKSYMMMWNFTSLTFISLSSWVLRWVSVCVCVCVYVVYLNLSLLMRSWCSLICSHELFLILYTVHLLKNQKCMNLCFWAFFFISNRTKYINTTNCCQTKVKPRPKDVIHYTVSEKEWDEAKALFFPPPIQFHNVPVYLLIYYISPYIICLYSFHNN